MGDYRLELTIKNGRLWRAMKEFGHETAASLSRACGVDQQTLGQYLNLKKPPMGKNGGPTPLAQRLCDYFGTDVRSLFPDEVLFTAAVKNKLEAYAASSELLGMSHTETLQPDQLLESAEHSEWLMGAASELTPRQRDVLNFRFGLDGSGEMTLDEVARQFGVTRERVKQIEYKALSRIKRNLMTESERDAAREVMQGVAND